MRYDMPNILVPGGINAKLLSRHWPLTKIRLGKILRNGHGRLVREVKAREGKFVMKVSDGERKPRQVVRDTHVFEFLRRRKFAHIPHLFPTKNGQRYIRHDGRSIYLMDKIEGKHLTRTAENYFELGKIVGKLHATKGYPYRTYFSVRLELPKLARKARDYAFGAEFSKLVRTIPTFENLPKTLIHTDTGLSNAIKEKNGKIILVDWDDTGVGPAVLDLGFPLICVFVDQRTGRFDQLRARAFYRGYARYRKISPKERAHVFDAALFFAMLYLPFGKDMNKRWKRAQWAVKHRKELERVL